MTDEQILEAIGVQSAPEQIQKTMIESIRNTVGARTAIIIEDLMTPEQNDIYQRLQSEGNDQALWDWARNDILGVDVSELYEANLKSHLEDLNSQMG